MLHRGFRAPVSPGFGSNRPVYTNPQLDLTKGATRETCGPGAAKAAAIRRSAGERGWRPRSADHRLLKGGTDRRHVETCGRALEETRHIRVSPDRDHLAPRRLPPEPA